MGGRTCTVCSIAEPVPVTCLIQSSTCLIQSSTCLIQSSTCLIQSSTIFRQVAASHSDHYRQVPLVGAGCFRQVAASHSDHDRQVPLVGAGCFRQIPPCASVFVYVVAKSVAVSVWNESTVCLPKKKVINTLHMDLVDF